MKNYRPPQFSDEDKLEYKNYSVVVAKARKKLLNSHLMSYSTVQNLIGTIHLNNKRMSLMRSKFRVTIDDI
jgi:hypothetical protein